MSSTFRVVSARDLEVLLALLHKVRVLSLRQLTDHWWNSEPANARRRLAMLVEADLLQKVKLSARNLPTLFEPVVEWHPQERAPDFGAVSYRLKSRWKQRAARTITAYVASERASRLLGGRPSTGLKSGTQATHDLAVAAVWLRLRAENPSLAEQWRGEDVMAQTRIDQKLPDAFLVDEANQVQSVIEFGGAYSAERVADFHADCQDRSLPYQIW